MAGSVNKVILIGNLGRDPEIRSAQSGDKVAQLSLATSESWKDKQTGEKKEKTEWHRVVVFNPHLITVIENWVKKGSKIYIEGALQTRKWTDNAGVEKYTTEIVLQKFGGTLTLLSDAKQQGDNGGDTGRDNVGGRGPSAGYGGGGAPAGRQGAAPATDLDDEIPF